MLILLQKYQLLNFTGFRKILKKHDKLFQTNRGEEWRYVFFSEIQTRKSEELFRGIEWNWSDILFFGL
jgi:SPX domain protein involved in polyphosphate accumulation